MTRVQRLGLFFDDYREIAESPSLVRLSSFLAAWQASKRSAARPGVRSLNIDRLENGIRDLAEPLIASRESGRYLNPWAAAGLRRNEVRNAGVLASLWRRETAGAAALAFLDAFLRLTERGSGHVLPSRNALERGYRVRTEHCLAGEQSERVDLTIEGRDFVIGVEVKIDAAEGNSQLDRYAASLAQRARLRGASPYLIFLAPYAHRGAVDDRHGVPVIDATWRDVCTAADAISGAGTMGLAAELIDRFSLHIARF